MATVRLTEKLKDKIAQKAGASLAPEELENKVPWNLGGNVGLNWAFHGPLEFPTLPITDKDDPNFGENGATNFAIERILPEDYTHRVERMAVMEKQFSDVVTGSYRLAEYRSIKKDGIKWTALIQLPLELIDFQLSLPSGMTPLFAHWKKTNFPYDRFFVPCQIELYFKEKIFWPRDWVDDLQVGYFSHSFRPNQTDKDWKAQKGTNRHNKTTTGSAIEYTLPIIKWEELPEKMRGYIETKINNRRQFLKGMEFRDSIIAVLEQCTTLKQFLEIWPQGDHLVPDEYLQKHKEKVVRNTTATKPQLSDEKRAELSVSLLRAKLGG